MSKLGDCVRTIDCAGGISWWCSRVINEDFRANNSIIRDGDANQLWDNRTGDAKIEFYLAGVDRREVKIYI